MNNLFRKDHKYRENFVHTWISWSVKLMQLPVEAGFICRLFLKFFISYLKKVTCRLFLLPYPTPPVIDLKLIDGISERTGIVQVKRRWEKESSCGRGSKLWLLQRRSYWLSHELAHTDDNIGKRFNMIIKTIQFSVWDADLFF